jgi:hypothetical protein
MLYSRYIRLVEEHAEKLTSQWITEVKSNSATLQYRQFSDQELHNRIFDVYERLGVWLMGEEKETARIGKHFLRLGRTRAEEGIKLSEVTYSLILSRVILLKYILSQGMIDTFFDIQLALEFYQKVVAFFDKAVYLVATGYESLGELSKEEFANPKLVSEAVNSVTRWFIK